MMSLIPLPARIGLLGLICCALYAFGMMHGESAVQAKWDAQKAVTQAAEASAINARLAANRIDADKQRASNAALVKAHDEELASVRAKLAAAERMRRPAFCGERPAATAKAASAGRSDGPDPASGLLPGRVESDIRALILQTEEVAATARACQRFVTDNGLAP